MYTLQEIKSVKEHAAKAQRVFRAINHPIRSEMLAILNGSENSKSTVTALYVKLRLEQSVCSQHLAILRRARLVATERDGKYIYYKADNENISLVDSLAVAINQKFQQ